MGIGRLLTHRVTVVRRGPVVDGEGRVVTDDYGQPLAGETEIHGVAVAIQPRSARELPASHQMGPELATHRIFATDRTITAADFIDHDPVQCPVSKDLPAGRYELSGASDAAGVGHHLELDATLVRPKDFDAPPPATGGSGSGS